MREYAKQCIREDNPDRIILHVGTNELSSENDAERVGKSVADPAKSLLSENWISYHLRNSTTKRPME